MDTLRTVSIVSLIIAGICALIVLVDIFSGHKQKMWIMDIVWPVTALYAGPLALIAYYTIGRKSVAEKGTKMSGHKHKYHAMDMRRKSFWQSVVVGTLHCGSGCTLGDIIAEFGLVLFPFAVLGSRLFGSWVVDYILAFFDWYCVSILFH